MTADYLEVHNFIVSKIFLAPTELHRSRYAKNKVLGMSTEVLAREEGVDEKYIKRSIAIVETYRSMVTIDDLQASQVEVILANKDLERIALRNALQAKTFTYDADGKKVGEEPNYEIQLSGVKTIATMVENLIGPRGRAVPSNANTTNVNIVAGGTGVGVGIATFEDRLREVKRKRALLEQSTSSSSDIEEVTPDWDGDTIEQSSS